MKRVLIRALPFLITFILGLVLAAIFGAVLPRHSKWEHGCSKKYKAFVQLGSVSSSVNTLDITQIRNSGETTHTFVSTGAYPLKDSDEEDALYFQANSRPGCCSNSDLVISYSSPRADDGEPVTSHATLINIPRPRFGDGRFQTPACNAMIRARLDADGTISKVVRVERYSDACPSFSVIRDAATNISFQPALRDGVPVAEEIAIYYSVH